MADTAVLSAGPAPSDVQLTPVAADQEAKDMDLGLVCDQERRSSHGETVDQALALQAEHDKLNQQALESDNVLGLQKFNTAMPIGLRALHKELAAFQSGTFRNMWRGSAYYIGKDKLLLLTTFIMMMAATAYTFWAPQWVAVSIRLVFQDGEGSIPFSDFCGWLFLYVATLALLWSGSASLLYVLYSRFVQRMRYHFANLGSRLYDRDSQIADSLFLERVEADVPETAAFWFKTVPTAIIAVSSVFLGFVMIFYHSWQVGMTALGLFGVFMVLSVLVDEVALRDAHVSAEEKRREDALWAKLHDHTTTMQERKECLMQINRMRALRASHGNHGLVHTLVGVLYRVLAFCTPVALFLVAGRNVIDSEMDQYQVVVVSVYFAYVVMCAFMLNGVIMVAASRIGAGVKLMGFVNETHAGLASQNRSRMQEALGGPAADRSSLELRMATPWILVGLALAFISATVVVTALIVNNASASQCPNIEYTCTLNMPDIAWSSTTAGTVAQEFDMSQGCSLSVSSDALLSQCALALLATAPKNLGVQTSSVSLGFETWSGTMSVYTKAMNLPTPTEAIDNTNAIRPSEPVDLSNGVVTHSTIILWCEQFPCGYPPRGNCQNLVGPPYYRCDCFEGWWGWACDYDREPYDEEGALENTTNRIGEVHRYSQCLNESLQFEPDAQEICDNLLQAVDDSTVAVNHMVTVYWWSFMHDEVMRDKQAAKYRQFYENTLAAYKAEQDALALHQKREAKCMRTRELLCLFSNNKQQCLANLQTAQDVLCNWIEKWFNRDPDELCARDCPAMWNCEIRGKTCYDCPRAICTRPRDQNVMLRGYRPAFNDDGILSRTSIVNIGGNASHVIDEFWGTAFADIANRLLEPRYVAYMCGELFPKLEVSFPQPLRVVKFAVNGWGDETMLRPPTFWTLEGTNDAPTAANRTWSVVGSANPEDWLTNKDNLGYPFEDNKIVAATAPGSYQHYRLNVRCDDLSQGLMIENWALFISGDDPMVHQAFDDEA